MSAATDDLPGLHRRIPALAECLPDLRRLLDGWAADAGLDTEDREGLVLAAYEAMANSVEHAYPDTDGMLDLTATRDRDGTITITIADQGRWRPPPPIDGSRGRGLPLMRALAHRTRIDHTDAGTTVTLTWTLAEGERPAP